MRSTQNEEGNKVDTAAILRITRAPKTPPTYVPRSRSLDDLPGGIRVPILLKPQSRVAARLEALQDGLQELTILREQQKTLVNRHFTDKGPSQGPFMSRRRYSTSALSSIREENTCENLPVFYQNNNNKTNGDDVFHNNSTDSCGDLSVSYSLKRRPSFQCDTIITKDFDKQIPYYYPRKDDQIFPSPMHAVMRQYDAVLRSASSESNLTKSASQYELKSQRSLAGSVKNVSKTEGLQTYLKQRRSSLPITLKPVKVTDIDQFWQKYSKGTNGNKCVKDDVISTSLDTTTESTLSSVEEETEPETHPNKSEVKNQSTESPISNCTSERHETAL